MRKNRNRQRCLFAIKVYPQKQTETLLASHITSHPVERIRGAYQPHQTTKYRKPTLQESDKPLRYKRDGCNRVSN